jgi:hypothetical protein
MNNFNYINRIDTYEFNTLNNYFNFKVKDVNNNYIISTPAFIQSPGKDWNCYNRLVKDLPYSNKDDKTYLYVDTNNTAKYKKKYLKYKEKYLKYKNELKKKTQIYTNRRS